VWLRNDPAAAADTVNEELRRAVWGDRSVAS
jgi:hypothetical protein